MHDLALIPSPLANEFQQRLEALLGAKPIYLSLGQMRRLPMLGLIRALWACRGRSVWVVLETPGSAHLLPTLAALAALTPARSLALVLPDLERRPIRRLVALGGLFIAALAIVHGFWSLLACRRELKRLAGLGPTPMRLGEGDALYIQANLWFGVQAGGSVGHIAGVVNGLSRRQVPLQVASLERPLLVDAAVPHMAVPSFAAFGLPPEINFYRAQRRFTKHLSATLKARPRFIYQRMAVSNYVGPVLAQRYRVPLILEYNGSELWVSQNWSQPAPFQQTALLAEEVCLRQAHLVVTVSDVLREELIARGVPPERVVTYPNCIDPQRFDPQAFSAAQRLATRRELGVPEDALLATFIGTFGQWHGVDVLARAIRQMVDEDADWLERHKVHFLLIGDGLKRPEVEQTLGHPRYRPYHTLAGLVPQAKAPACLAASDILLSPHVPNADGSRFFGSPTKLFEYMAMGKGIVASALEQIGAVLQPALEVAVLPPKGEAPHGAAVALLTAPADVDALIAGVRFLAENPAWGEHMGRNARALALSRYTWDQHVEAILQGLERVVAETAVPA